MIFTETTRQSECYPTPPAQELKKVSGKESDKAVDKFWEQEPSLWDTVNRVGLRANYVASVYAARMMVPRLELKFNR